MKRKKTYVTSFVGGLGLFEHLVEVLFDLGLPFEKLVHKDSAQPHSHHVLPRIYTQIHEPINRWKMELNNWHWPKQRKRKMDTAHIGEFAESIGVHLGSQTQQRADRRRTQHHRSFLFHLIPQTSSVTHTPHLFLSQILNIRFFFFFNIILVKIIFLNIINLKLIICG